MTAQPAVKTATTTTQLHSLQQFSFQKEENACNEADQGPAGYQYAGLEVLGATRLAR